MSSRQREHVYRSVTMHPAVARSSRDAFAPPAKRKASDWKKIPTAENVHTSTGRMGVHFDYVDRNHRTLNRVKET